MATMRPVRFAVLAAVVWTAAARAAVPDGMRIFSMDATRPGRVLPNTSQVHGQWLALRKTFKTWPRNADPADDPLTLVRYIEIFGATGGNSQRDCFRDPKDRTVRDDYDFSRLIEICRDIRALGKKPYLKLGSVPEKLSRDATCGDFSLNIRPPADYAEYGRYMEACARALLEAFGRNELLTWRFAVLTEYENGGWFKTADGNREATFEAYCRLYEVTAQAFARVISPRIVIGAHAMACSEGFWDERRFIARAGRKKLPLRFLTASFYDVRPGEPRTPFDLPATIGHLRTAAEAAGYTNLFYGVDEGRILYGRDDAVAKNRQLALRIVGDTYQAAFDARIVRQLFDCGAEYFATWGYFSGPDARWEGLPSVSFHVAKETSAFAGMRRLEVKPGGRAAPGVEVETVAAVSPDARTIRIMAYAYTNDLFAAGSTPVAFSVTLPPDWRNAPFTLTRRRVDDDANWFDEWRADRRRLNIGDDQFVWSPDDPSVTSSQGIRDGALRHRFRRDWQPRYAECAKLKSTGVILRADTFFRRRDDLPANAVLFYVLSRDKQTKLKSQERKTP